MEAAAGGIWLASWVAYGPTLTTLRLAVPTTILLGIAVTDLKHYVIPDGFTVSGFLFALVTPFRNGEIDKSGLCQLVDHVIEGGVDGVVPCGTPGEAPALSAAG